MTPKTPLFQKKNESFNCANCNHDVPLASSTCRDHCPQCLFSLHVDTNPGDRQANCGALLKPVSYSQHAKKGIVIHYVCTKCGIKKNNKFLAHDATETDSWDALLKLSGVSI